MSVSPRIPFGERWGGPTPPRRLEVAGQNERSESFSRRIVVPPLQLARPRFLLLYPPSWSPLAGRSTRTPYRHTGEPTSNVNCILHILFFLFFSLFNFGCSRFGSGLSTVILEASFLKKKSNFYLVAVRLLPLANIDSLILLSVNQNNIGDIPPTPKATTGTESSFETIKNTTHPYKHMNILECVFRYNDCIWISSLVRSSRQPNICVH